MTALVAPAKVTVVGIEAGDVAHGEALSDPVEAALTRAADLVLQLLEPLHPPDAATETGVSHA